MLQKNPIPNRPRKSLYSKLKTFCLYHRIPFVVFPIAITTIIAAAIVLIGGSIAGWNLGAILTSSTAILIYFVLVALVVLLILKWFMNRSR